MDHDDETALGRTSTAPPSDGPALDPVDRPSLGTSPVGDRDDPGRATDSGPIDPVIFLGALGCRFDFLDAESTDAPASGAGIGPARPRTSPIGRMAWAEPIGPPAPRRPIQAVDRGVGPAASDPADPLTDGTSDEALRSMRRSSSQATSRVGGEGLEPPTSCV